MSGWIVMKKVRGPPKQKGTVAAVTDTDETTEMGQASLVRFASMKTKKKSYAGAASVFAYPNVFALISEADRASDDDSIDFDIVAGVNSANT